MSKTKVAQVRVLLFNNEEIGMGFNSDTGAGVGTALDFDPPTRDPPQEAFGGATIVNSHDELMDALGLSAQAEGRYLFASGGLKAEFATQTNYNSVSTFVVARARVNNQITRGHNFRVTEPASHLLTPPLMDQFNEAFGDSFVRGIFTGGEFYAVMRISSVDAGTQQALAASAHLEVDGLLFDGSFQAAFTQATVERHILSDFFVTFYQKGGSGEQLATTLSINEVQQRMKDLPAIVEQNPFPYKIEVATYDTIPIPVPTKEQEDDFLLCLADTDAKKFEYFKNRNDLDFAAQNPDYFENPPPSDQLEAASEIFNRAANAAIDHAVRLSRGEINPPQTFDPASLTPPIVLPTIQNQLHKKAATFVKVPLWQQGYDLTGDFDTRGIPDPYADLPANVGLHVVVGTVVTATPPPDPADYGTITSVVPFCGTLVPRGTLINVEMYGQSRVGWITIDPPGAAGATSLRFPRDPTLLEVPLQAGMRISVFSANPDLPWQEEVVVLASYTGGRSVPISPTQHTFNAQAWARWT